MSETDIIIGRLTAMHTLWTERRRNNPFRLHFSSISMGAIVGNVKDTGGKGGKKVTTNTRKSRRIYLKGKVHLCVIEEYKTNPISITTARKRRKKKMSFLRTDTPKK